MSSTVGDTIENNDYPTPPWCVHRLLERVWLPRGRWLEPCAGFGSIITASNEYFGGAKYANWTAIELQKRYADDLAKLTESYDVRDFFDVTRTWGSNPADGMHAHAYPFDCVLTNPPFPEALAFVQRCRTLAPWVAMLLRVGFLEGGSTKTSMIRSDFLNADMPDLAVLPNRVSFARSKKTGKWGSDSATYAWHIWGPEKHAEGRIIRLANTTKQERMAWRAVVDKRMGIAA